MRVLANGKLIALVAGLAVLAGADAAGGTRAGVDEPFRTRNLNPLVSIFGVPVWRSRSETTRLVVTSELANHYRLSRRGDDVLILDGETWRNGLDVQRPVGERWFVGAEISYFSVSGGVLDDVVDAWHSAFSLPDGGRNNRPEGALRFQVANGAGAFYDLDARARGWGDLQLNFGGTFGTGDRFVLVGNVKLPTGDDRMLAGSGSTDWALTLLAQGRRELAGKPAGGFWGIGLVGTGDAERIDFRQNDPVAIATVGGGWRLLPRIGFRAQLDLHRPFYETRLEELGQASAQATLGGWFELNERARLEFAVNEDLHVSTSPDVVVHAALHWSWR